jgi:hypothetical protein
MLEREKAEIFGSSQRIGVCALAVVVSTETATSEVLISFFGSAIFSI